jgi:hypothetical protein
VCGRCRRQTRTGDGILHGERRQADGLRPVLHRIGAKRFSGGAFGRQITALAKSVTSQDGALLPISRWEANRKHLAKGASQSSARLYERVRSFAVS